MRALGRLPDLIRLLTHEADRGMRWRFMGALLMVAAGSLLTALAPLALKNLVDALAAVRPPDHDIAHPALVFGAAYLLALCVGRVLTETRPLLLGSVEQQMHCRVSRRFFAHLLKLPFAFHLGRPTGALVQSLSQATAGCQSLLVNVVQAAPIAIELVTVLAVLTHLAQPALVVTFVASAAAYALVFGVGTAKLSGHARDVSEAGINAHAVLVDSLLNIETIKCFNAASGTSERFAEATALIEARWADLHRHRAGIGLAVTLVFAVSVATSLTIAALAVARGTLSIGGFVLASVYMLQMVRPLEMLGAAVRDIGQAAEFARPLLEVMHTPAETNRSSDSRPAASPPVRLSFTDVHLAYGDGRSVLRGLNLDVPAGSTVAIVGASGSGKSTIVRLVLRLLEAQSGQIHWNGMPVDQLPIDWSRARIGLVAQDTALFNDTIAANIAIGAPGAPGATGAPRAAVEAASRRAELHDFIVSLPDGYETRVGERGLKLSGGERQRIAIARALLKRPDVYVFDEATSMLDSSTEAAILQNLKLVCAGCTTLVITHRLPAARCADEIAVLEDGRITERGSHADLLRQGGSYARMWHAQLGMDPDQAGPKPLTPEPECNGQLPPALRAQSGLASSTRLNSAI